MKNILEQCAAEIRKCEKKILADCFVARLKFFPTIAELGETSLPLVRDYKAPLPPVDEPFKMLNWREQITPTVSWKLGSSASVSFTCPPCGVHFIFYGSAGGPYLQGVINGLLEEHAGHDFVLTEMDHG